MFTFKYKAIDRLGNQIYGRTQGCSKQAIAEQLKSKGLQVLKVHKNLFAKKPSQLQLSLWARSVYQFLAAGMNLASALDLSDNKAVYNMKDELIKGQSITSVSQKHIFGGMFIGLMRVYERNGQLAQGFLQASEHYKFLYDLKRQILSKVYYPAVLLVVVLVTVAYFACSVVPTFAKMITEMGGTLPVVTRVMCSIAEHYLIVLIGLLGIISVISCKWQSIFSGCLKRFELTVFYKMFGRLAEANMNPLEALDIVAESLGTKHRKYIIELRAKMQDGCSLYGAVGESVFFTSSCKNLLKTAEHTNSLVEACTRLEEIHRQQLQDRLHKIAELIQPTLMIVVGIIFGLIVYAGVVPLYSVM